MNGPTRLVLAGGDMNGPTRLVLAGGGHSHVEVLRRFAKTPVPHLSITLVSRDVAMPYSGMLPGFIAGDYSAEDCHIDLRALAQKAGAMFCQADINGIDLAEKHLLCVDAPPVPFDLLSLNTGATPAMENVPGAREFAWPAKPVDAFVRNWQAIRLSLEKQPREHRFVIVGGGAGAVELTLAMQHTLHDTAPATFAIVSASEELLPTHSAGVRTRLERVLRARAVALHRGETAMEVTQGDVRCASGLRVPFDTLVWVTQAAAAPWLRASGLAVNDQGFPLVNDTLQSTSHAFVFVAGDAAHLVGRSVAKSGVYAVREAPVLADNLASQILGKPLRPYRPQKHHLSLISTGDRYAVASRGAWSIGGRWVWRWKDHIDRTWMRRYR